MEEQIEGWQKPLLFKSLTDLKLILSLFDLFMSKYYQWSKPHTSLFFNTPICIALWESSYNDSAAKCCKNISTR